MLGRVTRGCNHGSTPAPRPSPELRRQDQGAVMQLTLDGTAPAEPPLYQPTACSACLGSGWADPFEVFDGSPPLTWCSDCLGAGLEDCAQCDGYGAIPAAAPCPSCADEIFVA